MPTLANDLEISNDDIDNYAEEKIVGSGMPILHYAEETMLVAGRCLRNRAKLEAGGMDFTKVEKIKTLSGACRQLESELSTPVFPNSSSRSKWLRAAEEADGLLYDMKEATVYACRAHEEMVSFAHTTYNEGGSNSDKIQDLNDFSVTCKAHLQLFIDAKYDVSNFDRAAELAREMTELLAEATLDRSENPQARIRRDKAVSLLKNTTDDIVAQARFICRGNKKEAASYRIDPPRKKPKRKDADNGQDKA